MKNFSIALFIISLITLLLSIYLVFREPIPLQIIEVPAFVSITDGLVGFDLNSSALTYGSVLRGSNAMRRVSVENNYNFTVFAKSTFYGSISSFFEESSPLEIPVGEAIHIPFYINTNQNSSLGNYTGFVRIAILKKQYSLFLDD